MTFDTCLSGLNCASQALDVSGNNISNVNTVGFKGAQAHFADIFAATLAGASASAVGLGAGTDSVVQSFKQGPIAATNNALDMAINGRGFFRMDDNGTTTYSRDGQFHTVGQLDTTATGTTTFTQAQLAAQQLYVVDDNGLRLTGYNASYATDPLGTINANGSPTDILLDGNMPAVATTTASVSVNLDSRDSFITAAFDPNNAATYSAQSSVKAYDASGKRYDLATYFTNTASDTWRVDTTVRPDWSSFSYPAVVTAGTNDQFTINVNGAGAQTVTLPPSATGYADQASLVSALQSAVDAVAGPGGAVVSMQGNNLVINPGTAGGSVVLGEGNGAMAAYFGTTQTAGTLTFDSTGALNPASQTFTVAYGTPLASVQFDFSGSTQYASQFGVNSAVQNGYGNGQMTSMNVGADGIIQGTYSNGQTRKLAQVVLANFANPGGLINRGDNQWLSSAQSGAEQLDTPANANAKSSLGLGAIQGSALESSNVDLSSEMINLITQQRYYQANAQAIKTQDQVLQTLSNIT